MHSAPRLAFTVLVKFEDGIWVAHCLELDIVATGNTPDQAASDIKDLIVAQVSCALSNNNMSNLYHPAPKEVWDEFRTAKTRSKEPVAQKAPFYQTMFAAPLPQGNVCHA